MVEKKSDTPLKKPGTGTDDDDSTGGPGTKPTSSTLKQAGLDAKNFESKKKDLIAKGWEISNMNATHKAKVHDRTHAKTKDRTKTQDRGDKTMPTGRGSR